MGKTGEQGKVGGRVTRCLGGTNSNTNEEENNGNLGDCGKKERGGKGRDKR